MSSVFPGNIRLATPPSTPSTPSTSDASPATAADDTSRINEALAGSYDEVVYESMPVTVSHPLATGAVAKLFGLQPPPLATARILEIGSAAGGNILPFASYYPQSEVVGLELSSKQAALGESHIAKAGLKNARVLHGDVLNPPALEGSFDFIIVHGVFSWVPPAVQDAILKLMREKLSPQGVGFVSYNVYPGWKMREVLRDMMLHHSAKRATPQGKITEARAILKWVTENAQGGTNYANMLKTESAELQSAHDFYIYHEHLEGQNRPLYFKDFNAMAVKHGLSYLGDAALHSMMPQTMGDQVVAKLSELSGGNLIEHEQYTDFLVNRMFRTSLVVHTERLPEIQRGVNPKSVAPLYVQHMFVEKVSRKPSEGAVTEQIEFLLRGKPAVTVQEPLINTLFDTIARQGPQLLTYEEAAVITASRLGLDAPDASAACEAVFGAMLFLLVNAGAVLLAEMPPKAQITGKLKITNYNLALTQLGANWVANKMHAAMYFGKLDMHILSLLDGTRNRSEVEAQTSRDLQAGVVKAEFKGFTVDNTIALSQAVNAHVGRILLAADYGGLLESA